MDIDGEPLRPMVDRRTGGLEITALLDGVPAKVDRRTGGLETHGDGDRRGGLQLTAAQAA